MDDALVTGIPMLTFRATFESQDNLAIGLQRLDRWWRVGSQLSVDPSGGPR
ncbi:MAG: hypothetical protein ACRD1K_07875 [Acidimicrobiales bacterium]